MPFTGSKIANKDHGPAIGKLIVDAHLTASSPEYKRLAKRIAKAIEHAQACGDQARVLGANLAAACDSRDQPQIESAIKAIKEADATLLANATAATSAATAAIDAAKSESADTSPPPMSSALHVAMDAAWMQALPPSAHGKPTQLLGIQILCQCELAQMKMIRNHPNGGLDLLLSTLATSMWRTSKGQWQVEQRANRGPFLAAS